MIGKNPTFEDIKKEVRNMNLGEFLKFCKDFEIHLPKQVSQDFSFHQKLNHSLSILRILTPYICK